MPSFNFTEIISDLTYKANQTFTDWTDDKLVVGSSHTKGLETVFSVDTVFNFMKKLRYPYTYWLITQDFATVPSLWK